MATSHKYRQQETKRWTYGAELELVDWPRREPLPVKGMAIDDGAYTNVNSNGVAVDGPGKLYHLGGEILTAPSIAIDGPAEQLEAITTKWPETSLNYRMGLNVHVRVPGLRENLRQLKHLQAFIHRVMPELLPILDPIPEPTHREFGDAYKGARKCYITRKRDHHSLLPAWRLERQQQATTPREFFEAEAIHPPTGKVHWAVCLRACVNLRQLLQTDTIEFRHFFMPATPEELQNATDWCKLFVEAAFAGYAVTSQKMLQEFNFSQRAWPKPMSYDHWLDRGWHYTSRHHHDDDTVRRHIAAWLVASDRNGRRGSSDVPSTLFQE